MSIVPSSNNVVSNRRAGYSYLAPIAQEVLSNMLSQKLKQYVNNKQQSPNKQQPKQQPRRANKPAKQQVISAPVNTTTMARSSKPSFKGRSADSIRIVHRELISNITGTALFTVINGNSGFPLNPGSTTTFPWLSTQASSWEQYKFHRLRFCYYSRTGTSTPGTVMLAPDYDAADAAPASETVASSYKDCVAEVPWVTQFCCNLDSKAMVGLAPRKFIRGDTFLGTGQDIKTYDSGTMYVCTLDGTAITWGKLWVEYDVELFVPQLTPYGSALTNSLITSASTFTTANPWTPITAVTTGSTTGMVVAVGTTLKFYIPGRYLLTVYAVATTITATAVTPFGNTTFLTTYNPSTGYLITGSGTALYTMTVAFVIPNGEAQSGITWAPTVVGAGVGNYVIASLNSAQL